MTMPATLGKLSLGGRLMGGLFSTSMLLMAARVVGLLAGFGTQILLARMLVSASSISQPASPMSSAWSRLSAIP